MLVTRGGSSVGIEVDAKARRVESAAPWLRKIASVIEAVPPARTTAVVAGSGLGPGPLRTFVTHCAHVPLLVGSDDGHRAQPARSVARSLYADRIRASTAGRGRRREEAPAGLFITGDCPKSGFDRLSAGCPSAKAAPEPVL